MAFINDFQEKIWRDKYQYKDETYEEFCERVAFTIFADDKRKADRLKASIMDFRTLFGGRINSNIGTHERGLTLFNCFIEPISEEPDSLEGILKTLSNYALTLKSEGGVGFCANFFRPAKTLIRKIGVTSPGSVKFLELFNVASEVITSGSVDKEDSFQGVPTKSSIRKGATMVTMSACHPDIFEFITAKSIPNKLTKMNMSVLVTDAFMYAVDNDLDWDLWFPDINYDRYDKEWDGNFEKWAEKGLPTVVYKTIKAVELWELLLKSSYHRNEPGILFIDTIRRMDNINYLESSICATNPCIAKGTLVTTPNGIFPVETIVKGQGIQTTLGSGRTDSIEVHEDEDVYRVTFYDGFYQDVTMGHIFHTMINDREARKTWSNSKRLSDINVGEFVRKEWYKKFPDIDNTLSRDEGLLIGLYLGDGSFSNYNSFNISCNTTEDNKFIENLFKRLGGDCRINTSEGNCARYYYTNNSKYIKGLFKKLKIDPNGKSFDVCNLINTNRNFILGLIDGLLCSDGNVNLKGRYAQVRFKNSSMLIHNLLKHLFLFVKADYKVYTSCRAGEISKIYGREVIRKKDCPEGIIENDSILNLHAQIKYLSHPEKNEKLKTLIKTKQLNGVKWKTRIKSIEYKGKTTVYDLYEPNSDDWNHEGYVSRGCGEVVGNTGKITHKGKEYNLGDVCDLGSLNLTKYYDMELEVFNKEMFVEDVELMIEALDNVIDISQYPLDMYEYGAKMKRKIGLGICGLGSLFMMMGVRYGGEFSIKFTEDLLSLMMNTAYRTSALLAKEKGPFKLYSDKLLQTGYVKHGGVLDKDVLALIKKYGLRNSALSAIAPTGSLAILAGNVSGGLEPVFLMEFVRWNRVEGKKVDFKYPNVHKGEWFETDYLKEEQIADEIVLMSSDNHFRIDKNQGLCEEITISDYGYTVGKKYGKTEFTTTPGLTVQEHLNILSVVSRFCDLSASKTINLPADISFEEFKVLYGRIHDYGVKGCTTYRDGTSVAVLEAKRDEKVQIIKDKQEEFIDAFKGHESGKIIYDIIKLPEEYPSKGVILRGNNRKWYVHFSFMDVEMKKPFACFISTNTTSKTDITMDAIGGLRKVARKYKLNGKKFEEVEKKFTRQSNHVKIARTLGFLFRHNVPMLDIVKALSDVDNAGPGTLVFRLKKYLMNYVTDIDGDLGMVCPSCGSKDIILQEGCVLCISCGSSLCS